MFAHDRARKLLTLAITCIGFFMVLLDASIVTVALPTIQRSLNANLSDLQWVVDAYTLPFAVLLLTAGTLGDRFGRKRVFLVGLVIFTLGSTLCGFAPTLGWLIAGRVLQGVGGAALSPGSLSVLAAAFPEPRERTQVIGLWSGVSGIALAAGPLIGGALIQVSGWQAIFFVNLPVGVVALVAGTFALAESRNPGARRIDVTGQLAIIASLTALTYALIEGNTQGWGSTLIVGLFVAAGLLLIVFVAIEARQSEPMLPLGLFTRSAFSVANAAALVVGFALLGIVFFIAQYFQEVQGYSALGSGLRSLPNTAGIFLAAPIAGLLAARFGPRVPVTLGALCTGVALLLLTRLTATTDYSAIWWNLGLAGIGFGLAISPLAASVLSATPPSQAGLASSMVNASRQIGGVFGVAVLGAIVENQFAANLTTNFEAARIPSHIAQTIANTIASAGAEASAALHGHRLPIPPTTLHAIIGQSFTDALHPIFIVAGVALLATALLCLVALRAPREASGQQDNSLAPTESLAEEIAGVGSEIG